MSDAVAPRWRSPLAAALLLVGVVVAFVPGLMTGEGFLPSSLSLGRLPDLGEGPARVAMTYYPGNAGPPAVVAQVTLVTIPSWESWTLVRFVETDPTWLAAVAALLVAPALYVWWRRSGTTFVRVAGAAGSGVAVVAVSVAMLAGPYEVVSRPRGVWWTVPLGGALMGAAFVVAPAPRVRDE